MANTRVDDFIGECCLGLIVAQQVVIDDLLSIQDLQDIRLDILKVEEVRWIIELWIMGGCKRVSNQPIKPIARHSPRARGRAAIEGIKANLEIKR